tara:strand:+ start:446 stop:649 length:204 start_codon:yes stop_codon:yes gene_type:complete
MSILITFNNDETLEFHDTDEDYNRFNAEVHLDTYLSSGLRVEKLRCENSSDFMALQSYIDLLNLKIQ